MATIGEDTRILKASINEVINIRGGSIQVIKVGNNKVELQIKSVDNGWKEETILGKEK